MENKYYLAIADEVELDHKDNVKKTIIGLIILEVMLQLCYQLYPVLLSLLSKNCRVIVMAILVTFFVAVTKHFSFTTRVFNKQVKPLDKWLIKITLIILVLKVLLDLINVSSVFKLPIHQVVVIGLAALIAAVCEEFMFRGILFDIFLLIFRKSKFNIFWTAITSSALFSLSHLINLTHQPLISTLGQIIITFLLGLIFSYLHIWTNGLTWCIIFHFFQDFSPQLAKSDLGNPHIVGVMIMNVPVIIVMLICIYAFNTRYLKLNNSK
ncbi:CPBP family intramembrane glutamic endopeptidase [Lactobacillus agrestimuris]|uniref:CPBP family intramembrane glutamic endopeptidase n=1 Tax=Lactobacillus agrestimuris TaxID=2941328 RepID=UPI002044BEB2|nr:CPBP family intramembrane glutamic endopeptidase [Lactobacillus agrestimuris]